VGISGNSYKEWKGGFYPERISAKVMLSYYAQRLPAVEINNTFYRLPKEVALENWLEQVSDCFKFVCLATDSDQFCFNFRQTRKNIRSLEGCFGNHSRSDDGNF